MTQDEMNALMTERFRLEAGEERDDWQARAERAEAELVVANATSKLAQAAVDHLIGQTQKMMQRIRELEAATTWRPVTEPPTEYGDYLVGDRLGDPVIVVNFIPGTPRTGDPEYDCDTVAEDAWWTEEGGEPYSADEIWWTVWMPKPLPPAPDDEEARP